jgi:hypothetical protein
METPMSIQISPLPRADFAALFALDDEALKARGARRVYADAKPGFPCRLSLVDAEPGEELLLVNYEHQSADTPFRARHAVYVRPHAAEARPLPDTVPEALATRTLSLRAFDAEGMLRDADLVEGRDLAPRAEAMLADEAIAYLHAHYARPGCFAARIDRA